MRRVDNARNSEDVGEKAWVLSDYVRELLRETSELEVEERTKKVEEVKDELKLKVGELQGAFKEYEDALSHDHE